MKKLTTKQETKNIVWLGFGVILFSVFIIGLIGIIAPYSHWNLATFISLQVLSFGIMIMGVLIMLLASIQRKYVQIIKEIRETDYLADERLNLLIDHLMTSDEIIKEIREVKNLEENLP